MTDIPFLTQQLEGTLERLTYVNDETGYTVARLTPTGKTYLVTIVGKLPGISIGESLRLTGQWTVHSSFGKQFEVQTYLAHLPATIEGLRRYLGSGLVHGIGPKMASQIVDHFGLETLSVLDADPERLVEVPGIGKRRAGRIQAAWEEQRQIKEIMIFLQGHGVGPGLAVKLFRQYGVETIGVVRQNPYRLAREVSGVGFQTADQLAQQLGIPHDSPERVQAGLLHAVSTFSDEGHVYATRDELVAVSSELLAVDPEQVEWELDLLLGSQELIAGAEGIGVYLPPFYYAEGGIATRLSRLLRTDEDRLAVFQDGNWPALFGWLDRTQPFQLAERQKQAIRMALSERVGLLTGGPGTGKSTVTGSILKLLQAEEKRVLLAAPTGRAAKRLAEATGHPALTIHRLLGWEGWGEFKHNADNPLKADLLIIDEASMIDTLLMNHLTKAVAPGTHLLLVGDMDQLPSVGAGNVLRDLIASEVVPTVRLDTIYRQAADSHIILNAHRINQGLLPGFPRDSRDCFFFKEEDPARAAQRLVSLVRSGLPQQFGYSQGQIQVLSPMYRGQVGVGALNEALQAALNPPTPDKTTYQQAGRLFCEGDRVMQTRNNYDKDVFNGDIGHLVQLDLAAKVAVVDFEGQLVEYEFHQLDQVVHAYAISVHKSQGSEYPVVVLPMLEQHHLLLQRNLLYTAFTRARERVILVGTQRAIARAVANNEVALRHTDLAARLRRAGALERND